jgi:hypothetical protein
MPISFEGKLSLVLGLIALAGGGAIMVAPEKLWIGWTLIGIALAGGGVLGFHHFGRRFCAIFLIAGVLWFDCWYYSNVLHSDTQISPRPIFEATSSSTLKAATSPGQLLSRLDHFIFVCDVPPPAAEAAAKFPQAKEEMRQRYLVWGDVVGMSFTVTDIRGGYRIDAEAATEEAKRRMFVAGSAGATKFSIALRRIDQQIIVDVTSELPQLYGLIKLDPSSQDTRSIQQTVEKLAGAEGKCHLV